MTTTPPIRPPAWLIALALTGAGLAWLTIGTFDRQAYGAAVIFAWATLGAATWTLGRGAGRPPPAPWLDRADLATWALTVAIGVAAMIRIRITLPVSAEELLLFPARQTGAWETYLQDVGLPSLVHNLGVLTLRHAGGLELVSATHALAFAGFAWCFLGAARRLLPADVARIAMLAVCLTPSMIEMFTEARSYATYLLFTAWASREAIAAWQEPHPARDARVVLVFGLATLEATNTLVLIAAYALGRAANAGWPRPADLFAPLRAGAAGSIGRLWQASLIFGVGMVAVVLCARSLRYTSHDTPSWFLDSPWTMLVTAAALTLLALQLRHRPSLPSALPAFVALGTAVLLAATGVIRDAPKYALYAAPLAVPHALAGLRTALVGRPRAHEAVLLALVAIPFGAAYWRLTPVLHLYEVFKPWEAPVVVLTVLALFSRPRIAPLAAGALVLLGSASALRAEAVRLDRQSARIHTAAAAWEQLPRWRARGWSPVCAPSGEVWMGMWRAEILHHVPPFPGGLELDLDIYPDSPVLKPSACTGDRWDLALRCPTHDAGPGPDCDPDPVDDLAHGPCRIRLHRCGPSAVQQTP